MNFRLFKISVYSYFTDILVYVCALFTVISSAFSFFFGGHFFVETLGSTDLGSFFNFFPKIFSVTVPVLVFKNRNFIADCSMPVSSFKKFLTLSVSSFAAAVFPVVLLFFLPFFVNFFGDIDAGTVFTGFSGIFLFLFCSVCFSYFLFSVFKSPSVALLVSVPVLFLLNLAHLLPLYVEMNGFSSEILKNISFAWHFSPFQKGIFDSADFFFIILVSLCFILLCVFLENRKTGLKTDYFTVFLLLLTGIFLFFASKNLSFRMDFTQNREFSVSDVSKKITSALESPVRITYFQSRELNDFYPAAKDVLDFLENYSRENENITLSVKITDERDVQNLSMLGIQGQPFERHTGNNISYTAVYSAVLIQYLEKSAVIPFVLSTENLEFDLTQKIQNLAFGKTRNVLALCTGETTLEKTYSYVKPWLESRGFTVFEANTENFTETAVQFNQLGEKSKYILLLFGAENLTREICEFIENEVISGIPLFIAASPYTAAIESDWNIKKTEGAFFFQMINSWGFSFDSSLVNDVSCFRIALQAENENGPYTTEQYPLWIQILPQENAPSGITVFWPSPVFCYGSAEPLLETTPYAWLTKEIPDGETLFTVNPFFVPKNAVEAGSRPGKYTVAATTGSIRGFFENGEFKANVTLVSDSFFVSSLLTGFISGANGADLRNYDFLSRELLILNGEEEISSLMNKRKNSTILYKITDRNEFLGMKNTVLLSSFLIIPLSIIMIYGICLILKRKKIKDLQKEFK